MFSFPLFSSVQLTVIYKICIGKILVLHWLVILLYHLSSSFHHQDFPKHSVNSKRLFNELIFIFLPTNTRNLPNNSIEQCSQGIHFLFLFSLIHLKLTSQALEFPQHLCNLSCHLVTFHYFLFYKQLLIILPNQIINYTFAMMESLLLLYFMMIKEMDLISEELSKSMRC